MPIAGARCQPGVLLLALSGSDALDPDVATALGDAFAEICGAEAGTALASGMGAVHAALGANLSAGDRVVAPLAAYGSSRKLLT